MNFERAQQIFNSPETIEVLHNGNQVWIERLNTAHQTAYISMQTPSEQKLTVPVSELKEV